MNRTAGMQFRSGGRVGELATGLSAAADNPALGFRLLAGQRFADVASTTTGDFADVSTHGFIRADIVEPDARAVTGLIRRTIHNAPDVVQRPISRR